MPVRGIGKHALFVGINCSVAVDSRKVPTVEPGSIYYADLSEIRSYNYDHLSWHPESNYVFGYGIGSLEDEDRPIRLDQLLAEYCRKVEDSEF